MEIEQIFEILKIITQIVVIIYGSAVAIARITPTKKDDNFLQKFRKFFEKIQNIIPDNKK